LIETPLPARYSVDAVNGVGYAGIGQRRARKGQGEGCEPRLGKHNQSRKEPGTCEGGGSSKKNEKKTGQKESE